MDVLWSLSAARLAQGIAAGDFSAREVVSAHLERIASVNPSVNALTTVFEKASLDAAGAVDAARSAGKTLGPLAGVPITIKDNIDYVASATTQGLPALANALPAQNAPIVDRVLAAGAIPIGRSNMPDMGLRLHTDNALNGPTRNPWDAGVTTGGSSGGEAAALAAGMTPFGLGNDIGGSLRNPATCCGIASIKPTQGVVPFAVTIPSSDAPISFQLMCTDGPMARTVADVRLGLDILEGYHPRDPASVSAVFTQVDRPLKVAVMAEPPGGEVDPRIAVLTRQAGQALKAAGCSLEETVPPDFEAVMQLWADMLDHDFAFTVPLITPMLSRDANAFLSDFRADQEMPSVMDYAKTLMERLTLGRAWAAFFEDYDVLLSSTWTALPFPVGWDIAEAGRAHAVMRQARCVMPGNALGLPSACVPAGLVDGLPVGVLLTGGRFSDHLCLDAAEIIESAMALETPIDPRQQARS